MQVCHRQLGFVHIERVTPRLKGYNAFLWRYSHCKAANIKGINRRLGPHSVSVSVQDCYAGDPGSIPGPDKKVGEGWKYWAVFL